MTAYLPRIVGFGVLALFVSAATLGMLSVRPESLHTIDDRDAWESLCARPASSPMARTEVVKFLVDLEHDRTLWFVDTQRWDVHYAFALDRLSILSSAIGDHAVFNAREYHSDERRFEAGSIVHYVDGDRWTVELLAGDTLSGERILRLFEQLRAAIHVTGDLRFFPRSPLHEANVASLGDRLPRVAAEEVMRGVAYQPLTHGLALGTLRFVRGEADSTTFRPDEVVVVEHLPDEIPVVAGVVSAELEAPLGHIAILCSTRETPNMGLRDALRDPRLAALEGQLVELTVGPQEWSIRAASRDECEGAWASRRPAPPSIPPIDRTSRAFRDVVGLRSDDASSVGAKAAQLGEASAIPGVRTPGGFAVPFAHYVAHLERHGLGRAIDDTLGAPRFDEDASVRSRVLGELRGRIESADVDPALLDELDARLAERPTDRWIFRSSTNAEDLPGFTGAGLYRSIVVGPSPSREQIASALREVWASVWLSGAHEERAWFGIPDREVAMAVLVQPFVDGAIASGVAITANPYTPRRPGFLVNMQASGGSVTGAHGGELPESYLLYTFMDAPEYELLTRSTRSTEALLGEPDLARITHVLGLLHGHFVPRWAGDANAVDVELLIAGDEREVVVLQARPYTVRWSADE